MNDNILLPYAAIMFGAVLGIAACLPIQAVQNVSATVQCKRETQTHKLVSVRNFWGDSKHCVQRRYL